MSALNIEQIRQQFPALTGDHPSIFLDGPGGTQTPVTVIEAMKDCMINSCANLGGLFETSRRATQIDEDAHVAMADFVNAFSPREIIFGQNMTTLTFQISRSLGRQFAAGDEIIVTAMDHDANISPWLLMARDHGLNVKVLPFNSETFEFDLDEFDRLLSEKTRLVCVNHASNLIGTINDVKTIVAKAKSVGALSYIDSVQFAAHGAIDVQNIGCDFLVCSSYKFFGPHMGVLWGREEVLRTFAPYKVRPASEDLPGCFETGTLSHEGLAGVIAAVDYLAWIGRDLADTSYQNRYPMLNGRRRDLVAAFDCLQDYELRLTKRLITGLQSIPDIKIYGITNFDDLDRRVPTFSFTKTGTSPQTIAEQLGNQGIYVWDGHNYAIEIVRQLGLLDKGGVVRIGLTHYNTEDEVDKTVAELAQIVSI